MKNSHIACLIIVGIVVIVIIHAVFIIDWYANDLLDGSEITDSSQIKNTVVTDIICPDGFTAIPEAILTSPQNNSKEMICLGEEVQFENTEILRCGDEYVSPEGMVTKISCTISTP